jgi:hypothetical protein
MQDKELRLRVLREFARRSLDTRFLDVFCSKGVVRLSGRVTASRAANVNLKEYFATITEVLRRIPEVRDVLSDVSFR